MRWDILNYMRRGYEEDILNKNIWEGYIEIIWEEEYEEVLKREYEKNMKR